VKKKYIKKYRKKRGDRSRKERYRTQNIKKG
jgi:hypothetical protein